MQREGLTHQLSVRRPVRRRPKALATVLSTLILGSSAAAQPGSPELKITGSADSVTVSWPLTAYYFVLEGKTNLDPAVSWENLVTASKTVYSVGWQPGGALALTTNIIADEAMVTLPATNAQQVFRLKSAVFVPVFQFAIFYNGLLEFSTCPVMTINGPVHANGPIYTGTSLALTLNDTVTTSGTISSPTNNGQGPIWANTGTYNGNPPSVTNVPPLLPPSIGTNDAHVLIDQPPFGEDPDSILGRSRFYNLAHIVLLVSNAWVEVRIQQATDPSPIILRFTNSFSLYSSSLPFLNLTNRFKDQREHKTNITTQLDIGKYAVWLQTNAFVQAKFPSIAGFYPTIHYVADNRTTTANQMTVVRLTNGVVTPKHGGFTVVTPNPLYIWGHYNCTNPAYLGSTNTTATVPCALISDALTILSSNWKDYLSLTNTFSGANASWDASPATTVNAAILTGVVPSTGSGVTQYSGGVHNLPRLLEDWNACDLWLNTSLVSLYNSARATGQFQNPNLYYRSPNRHFNFDSKFTSLFNLPPGTPLVTVFPPAN